MESPSWICHHQITMGPNFKASCRNADPNFSCYHWPLVPGQFPLWHNTHRPGEKIWDHTPSVCAWVWIPYLGWTYRCMCFSEVTQISQSTQTTLSREVFSRSRMYTLSLSQHFEPQREKQTGYLALENGVLLLELKSQDNERTWTQEGHCLTLLLLRRQMHVRCLFLKARTLDHNIYVREDTLLRFSTHSLRHQVQDLVRNKRGSPKLKFIPHRVVGEKGQIHSHMFIFIHVLVCCSKLEKAWLYGKRCPLPEVRRKKETHPCSDPKGRKMVAMCEHNIFKEGIQEECTWALQKADRGWESM